MEPSGTEDSTILSLLRFIFSDSFLYLSSLSSHPLFSVFVASSILAALYVPGTLIPLLLSPVTGSVILLLLALLLRLAPASPAPPAIVDELTVPPPEEIKIEVSVQAQEIDQKHQKEILCDAHVDCHRWSGPLEVIYEEYEGEEAEESGWNSPEYSRWSQDANIGGGGGAALGSLAFANSDSDTESSGSSGSPMAASRLAEEWGSQEKISFRWPEDMELSEGDDEDDQLIEIELEEDNLIEIDIFGGR